MSRRSIIAALALGCCVAAATPRPSYAFIDENEGWDYRVQVTYAPLAIDAKSTVEGLSASFVSGSDDLLAFDSTGIKIKAEAWKNRLGFIADNTLSQLDAESRIDNTTTAKLDARDLSSELAASYIVGQTPHLSFEGMAGMRLVALKQELTYSSGPTETGRKRYIDPLVGARVTWTTNGILSADLRGNVGGFGVGSASELTWILVPEINIHLSKSALVNIGYRHQYVRTEDENGDVPTQFNGSVYGTFIGAEFRFR